MNLALDPSHTNLCIFQIAKTDKMLISSIGKKERILWIEMPHIYQNKITASL